MQISVFICQNDVKWILNGWFSLKSCLVWNLDLYINNVLSICNSMFGDFVNGSYRTWNKEYTWYSYVCLILRLASWNWQWRSVENNTLRQKRRVLSINIPTARAYYEFINTYIIVYTIFQSLHFMSWFLYLDWGMLLTRKILRQEFQVVKSKSYLRKYRGRHHELTDHLVSTF